MPGTLLSQEQYQIDIERWITAARAT